MYNIITDLLLNFYKSVASNCMDMLVFTQNIGTFERGVKKLLQGDSYACAMMISREQLRLLAPPPLFWFLSCKFDNLWSPTEGHEADLFAAARRYWPVAGHWLQKDGQLRRRTRSKMVCKLINFAKIRCWMIKYSVAITSRRNSISHCWTSLAWMCGKLIQRGGWTSVCRDCSMRGLAGRNAVCCMRVWRNWCSTLRSSSSTRAGPQLTGSRNM